MRCRRIARACGAPWPYWPHRIICAGRQKWAGGPISVFLDDESDGYAETRAFLDRRIENVMQFEKVKARVTGRGGDRFSIARFVGRLRYRGV